MEMAPLGSHGVWSKAGETWAEDARELCLLPQGSLCQDLPERHLSTEKQSRSHQADTGCAATWLLDFQSVELGDQQHLPLKPHPI